MKKIATLILAAGLVFGVSTGAKAIDFKAHGEWIMDFNYGMHGNATGAHGQTGSGFGPNQDEFEASQRVRLQLDAVASEALSGTVFFEIGQQIWGRANEAGANNGWRGGAALGADGTNAIKVRRAYIDWMVPNTDLKVRMGIQGFALPSFTTNANAVFDDDVAAVVASYQFNENVGLTAFWLRPFNDNSDAWETAGHTRRYANYMDNLDAFGLVLPLTFDGVKVTPWAMYAAIGPDTFRRGDDYFGASVGTHGTDWGHPSHGMTALGGAMHKDGTLSNKKLKTYGNAIWAGLTGEVTAFDPFRIAWDVNYGSVSYDDSRANRSGWLASLLFEYKLDWAIPGIYGWYGSGDDNNPANGSERMPYLAPAGNNDFSRFAFSGGKMFGRESVLSDNMVGTWGIGARLKDMSFIEDLKHTFHVNFMGGTNSTTMARYFTGNRAGDYLAFNNADGIYGPNDGPLGAEQLYMTTNDYALEIGLHNAYKMYENFNIYLDANYIALWMDHSKKVWGNSKSNGRDDTFMDPWNVRLSFVYSF